MKIGFIGLGIMGKPMAKNIIRRGYDVSVYSLHKESVAPVAAEGATALLSAREIGMHCDVILTMLPNSPEVKDVLLGEGGVIETVRPGSVVIDMSSINPIATKEIAAEFLKKEVSMLDAPVSGGEPRAIDGTLSFMVGGEKSLFEKYKPLLQTMGTSIVHCGEVGAGNATKLANQMIVALNIAAVSEALMLGKKAGVSPRIIFEAIKSGLAGSAVMETKVPMMLQSDFRPGFKIELHSKDLINAIDVGNAVGAPMPLTAAVAEMLESLKADGFSLDDHSALCKYYEKLAGVKISD